MAVLCHVHQGLGRRLDTFQHATVIARSWLRNDAGSAQIALPQGDPQCNPTLLDAGNWFVIESDQGVPPWVGFQAKRYREDGRRATLTLTELPGLLGRRMTRAGEIYTGGAGGILKAAFQASQRRLPLPVRIGDMTDTGSYAAQTFNVQSLLSIAQDLATKSSRLWWFDQTVTEYGIDAALRWGARRGRDRLDLVLAEGQNLTAEPVLEDLSGQPLDSVYVVGQTTGGSVFSARPQAQATAASGSTIGGQTAVISETLADEQSALQAARTAVTAENGLRLDLVTADPIFWQQVFLDDVVRVILGTRWNRGQGLDTSVRIVGMQADEPTGQLRLMVEVVE